MRGTRADTTAKVDENGKVAEDVYLETTEKVEDTTDPIAKATVPANAKTTAAFGDDTVPLALRVEEAPTANITVSNTFVSEMAESKPWQTITNYQGNLLIAFTAGDEEILSQDTIDGTLKAAHARKMNLYGQFYDATYNYTGVEGADDEAVRNRIEAQTAQFFRQTLLCVWGDAVNSGVELKENIPLLYALGVKTSGCVRGEFLYVCSFGAACLSGDKMLYSKYVLIRKEEETWIL